MRTRIIALTAILLCGAVSSYAKKTLRIESDPAGARVEIAGEFAGTTPLTRENIKDFWFQGPLYAWSEFLATPLQMTVSKEGYVTQTIVITKGPFVWASFDRTTIKYFYAISSTYFNVKLQKVGEFLGSNPLAGSSQLSATVVTDPDKKSHFSTEEIVQKAMPAVVTVRSSTGSGSGFFITDTGVVVTNKHVVEGSQSVSVVSAKGETFPSESIFVDQTKDLALIRVKGASFPYLKIADPRSVNVGAEVIAIGSPGIGGGILPNTVTKGIISAFRDLGQNGLYVQTDVAINHGNSGGPLMDSRGDVVGVNTLGLGDFGMQGLNFAIYGSEILTVLKKQFHYEPPYLAPAEGTTSLAPTEQRPLTEVTSEPSGAEIYLDGVFTSGTPSKLSLSIGEHTIRVSRPGFKDWERRIVVDAGSSKTVNAILEKKNGP